MRVSTHPNSRFLGYVQVRVASHVYNLAVEAAPLQRDGKPALQEGFFSEGAARLGILVDIEAPATVQQETIQRASADAARHISRNFLN
jgi:hypothetical protein